MYEFHHRSKNWQRRIFTHFIFVSARNAHILYNNVFQNINHSDILCVAVYIKADYEIPVIPNFKEDEEINLSDYFKQICDILYLYSTKHSYINRIENFKNPLIITKSHFKTFYNFEITKKEMKFIISEDDIESLILQGFHDISEYMKTFNEEVIDV